MGFNQAMFGVVLAHHTVGSIFSKLLRCVFRKFVDKETGEELTLEQIMKEVEKNTDREITMIPYSDIDCSPVECGCEDVELYDICTQSYKFKDTDIVVSYNSDESYLMLRNIRYVGVGNEHTPAHFTTLSQLSKLCDLALKMREEGRCSFTGDEPPLGLVSNESS